MYIMDLGETGCVGTVLYFILYTLVSMDCYTSFLRYIEITSIALDVVEINSCCRYMHVIYVCTPFKMTVTMQHVPSPLSFVSISSPTP